MQKLQLTENVSMFQLKQLIELIYDGVEIAEEKIPESVKKQFVDVVSITPK